MKEYESETSFTDHTEDVYDDESQCDVSEIVSESSSIIDDWSTSDDEPVIVVKRRKRRRFKFKKSKWKCILRISGTLLAVEIPWMENHEDRKYLGTLEHDGQIITLDRFVWLRLSGVMFSLDCPFREIYPDSEEEVPDVMGTMTIGSVTRTVWKPGMCMSDILVSLQVPFRNISEDYEGDVEFTGTLQTPEYVQPLGKNALRMSLALICLDVPLCDHNATVKPGPCRNLEMMCPTFSGILSLESSIKLCQSASKTGLGQCPDVCAAHVVHESSRSHDRNVCALSRRPSTSKSTNSCSNSVADIEEPAHFASPLDKIEP